MIFHAIGFDVLIGIEFIILTCFWQIRCKGRDSVPDNESVKNFCDEVASICSIDYVSTLQFMGITSTHSFN